MDFIDRYVGVVRLFLPKGPRDDIVSELAGDLRAAASDKESELGRPLSKDEQASLLRKYGHPMLIAARYGPARYLIGPVLFPLYRQALTLVLGLIVAGHLASLMWLAVGGASWPELGAALTRLIDNGLDAAVFITLLAACWDWSLTRSKVLERWDPTSMGPSDGPMRLAGRTIQRARTDSLVRRALDEAGPPLQARSMFEFVAMLVLATWAVLGLAFPYLVFGSGASMLAWAPSLHALWPLFAFAGLAVLIDQYLRLTRPAASFVRAMRIVWANAGWVLIVLLVLAERQWIIWIGTPEQWSRFGALVTLAGRTWSLVDVVNAIMSTVFGLAAVVMCFGGHLSGGIFRRNRQAPA